MVKISWTSLAQNHLQEIEGYIAAQSAGMDIKGHSSKAKGELTIKQGKISGKIILTAHAAGKHAAYEWQQSADNTAWADCNPHVTTEAKNTISGLILGTVYYFRFKTVLPKKTGKAPAPKTAAQGENWSQSVKIIVT